MGAGEVRFERRGAIGTITLAQPGRRNAITVEMWRAIRRIVGESGVDAGVRVLVLRGDGAEHFSAGADISEFEAWRSNGERGLAYQQIVGEAIEAVAAVPKPVIAMIRGACLGGACELAIACDVRFAAEGARFGIPAARLAIQVDLPEIARLVALVGAGRARELLYGGEHYDAAWAERAGLVNRVLPPDRLEVETYAWAERVAANAPGSIRWAKWAVTQALRDPDLSESPDHLARMARHFDSEDYHEGRRAFLEKRPPRFTGR